MSARFLLYRGRRLRDEAPVILKLLRAERPSFSELLQFRNQYTIVRGLQLPGVVSPLALERCHNGFAIIMADDGYVSLEDSLRERVRTAARSAHLFRRPPGAEERPPLRAGAARRLRPVPPPGEALRPGRGGPHAAPGVRPGVPGADGVAGGGGLLGHRQDGRGAGAPQARGASSSRASSISSGGAFRTRPWCRPSPAWRGSSSRRAARASRRGSGGSRRPWAGRDGWWWTCCRTLLEAGREDKRLRIEARASGPGHFQLVVRDNGVGIPAEDLQRVFQYGFTTRQGSLGYGLHWAANTAREMGGPLGAASEGRGQGSSFTLELPL